MLSHIVHDMFEPGDYPREWLESYTWEPSKAGQHEDTVEDLDEFAGVIEALSVLDGSARAEIGQYLASTGQPASTSATGRRLGSRASDAISAASSSSLGNSNQATPRSWPAIHRSMELPRREMVEAGTSGSALGGQKLEDAEAGSNSDDEDTRERSDEGVAYKERFGKIFTEETALKQRLGDLERKVNMLIAEEYFHRVTVPQGCFVVVLPGPGCAYKFTEDLMDSLQSRLEGLWPLCYFSPVVTKLARLATAILGWFPLPAPLYTCNFPPQLECRSPDFDVRKPEICN